MSDTFNAKSMEDIEGIVVSFYRTIVNYKRELERLEAKVKYLKAKLFEHYINAVKEKSGLVEDEMYRYFMSLDSSSDIYKMYVLRNYGNSRINILRDQLKEERIGYLTLINWWEKRRRREKGSIRQLTEGFAEAYANRGEWIYS